MSRIRTLAAEADHPHGKKVPRWFSAGDLTGVACHPASTIEKAFRTPIG